MENKRADAGQDGQTLPARPNYQARVKTGNVPLPYLADHEQDWQPYLVDSHFAIFDDHTYIYTRQHTVDTYAVNLVLDDQSRH